MRKNKSTLLLSLVIISVIINSFDSKAQIIDDEEKTHFKLAAFADIYYGYDFNHPVDQVRLPFLYNHTRHNQLGINLALIKASYSFKNIETNIALHAGDYVHNNFSSEPTLLAMINEANISWTIDAKRKWKIDAGIMPSYIGWESAISSDNLTLSRSLAAENSPYIMTGAKITYLPTHKWSLSLGAYNGWQRIQRLTGNSLLSLGAQITYNFDGLTVNYSNYFGPEDVDSVRKWRFFNNLFIKKRTNRVEYLAGFDYGIQQISYGSKDYLHWFTPVLIASYDVNSKFKIGGRLEFFKDYYNVIIVPKISNPVSILGLSINSDYIISEGIMWRNEFRFMKNDKEIFELSDGSKSKNNIYIGTSLSVKWNKIY